MIRRYGSRRVLLVVRGALFRVASFSVLCRRVLFFYSIHSGPSHFVSVNPVSSGGSPASPSPLYAQVRPFLFLSRGADRAFCCQVACPFKLTSEDAETRNVRTRSARPPSCVHSHECRKEESELITGKCGSGGKTEEDPPRFETSFVVHMSLYNCHESVHFGECDYKRKRSRNP